jgi:hypothetical protein
MVFQSIATPSGELETAIADSSGPRAPPNLLTLLSFEYFDPTRTIDAAIEPRAPLFDDGRLRHLTQRSKVLLLFELLSRRGYERLDVATDKVGREPLGFWLKSRARRLFQAIAKH